MAEEQTMETVDVSLETLNQITEGMTQIMSRLEKLEAKDSRKPQFEDFPEPVYRDHGMSTMDKILVGAGVLLLGTVCAVGGYKYGQSSALSTMNGQTNTFGGYLP
jgi:hypothetical protein